MRRSTWTGLTRHHELTLATITRRGWVGSSNRPLGPQPNDIGQGQAKARRAYPEEVAPAEAGVLRGRGVSRVAGHGELPLFAGPQAITSLISGASSTMIFIGRLVVV